MPGRAAKVIITERQQEILQTMSRQRTCAQGLVLRADLILLAFQGVGAEEIAQRLGCERHSVGVWRRRWADAFQRLVLVECCEGMTALRQAIVELLSDLPRSGCFGKFTPEQITLILAVACEPPEDSGRPVSHWTPRELADEVRQRGIVESISRRQVARFLKRPNSSPTAAATGSMPGQRTPKRFNSRSKRFATAT
jgi:putative transposase